MRLGSAGRIRDETESLRSSCIVGAIQQRLIDIAGIYGVILSKLCYRGVEFRNFRTQEKDHAIICRAVELRPPGMDAIDRSPVVFDPGTKLSQQHICGHISHDHVTDMAAPPWRCEVFPEIVNHEKLRAFCHVTSVS